MHENLNKEYSCGKYDFVNSTNNGDFLLTRVECPHPKWNQGTNYYKIETNEDDGPVCIIS